MRFDSPITANGYYIRLNTAAAQGTQELNLLLDELIARTRADGAVAYHFDPGIQELRAVATQPRFSPRIPELGVTLTAEATAWLRKEPGPGQESPREPLQVTPATDMAFENLPEVLQCGFRSTLLFPFHGEYDLLGFLTLGRRSGDLFDPQSIRDAQPLAGIVAALLERDALQQAMKERKIVERAMGIVQRREGLSEEKAYLYLRNTSRRRRIPMAEVAREVVETGINRVAALSRTA